MRVLGRRRSTYLVLLILCAVLSVWPIPLVHRAIDLLFVPTRIIAELVAPLSWARSSDVRAAEVSIDRVARDVRGSAARLLSEEQLSAMPTRPELLIGRRRIHGEVIRRSRGNLDAIEVRVSTTEGIVPDLPVVTGDHYIGRVLRLDTNDPSLIHVGLVTGADFCVSVAATALDWRGEPKGQDVPFVVGGLAQEIGEDDGQLHLALHNPILRGLEEGRVFVSEPATFDSELAQLSRGFLIGELQTVIVKGGSKLQRIQSPLDFKSGLFQVIVLTPEDGGAEARLLELDTFVDGNWVAARAMTRGDVTPTREGRRLSKGALGGVETGRAVALGAHLIGRVGEVSSLTADLQGLGDPGVRLAVLAKIDGESVPRPMGEIVSLGRDREDGTLRFRWTCRIDLQAGPRGAPLRAELYTGSGEDGVPRGLYIGLSDLPTQRDTHEIRVYQDPEVRDLSHLFVWTGAARARSLVAEGEQ